MYRTRVLNFQSHGVPYHVNEHGKFVKIQNFKNPKSSFVRTIEKIIQEKFDKFQLRFVEEVVFFFFFFLKSYVGKNRKCTELPQNDLECYEPQSTQYVLNYYPWVPNVTLFWLLAGNLEIGERGGGG